MPRIFEPFYTADDAQGSGLGLAIASELAERMAGACRSSPSRERPCSRSRSLRRRDGGRHRTLNSLRLWRAAEKEDSVRPAASVART